MKKKRNAALRCMVKVDMFQKNSPQIKDQRQSLSRNHLIKQKGDSDYLKKISSVIFSF